MSVEDCAVICYGISKAFKRVDKLPYGGAVRVPAANGHVAADDGGGLQRVYAKGWLGMMLSVRVWSEPCHNVHSAALTDLCLLVIGTASSERRWQTKMRCRER